MAEEDVALGAIGEVAGGVNPGGMVAKEARERLDGRVWPQRSLPA
jgi:hypothetical protein